MMRVLLFISLVCMGFVLVHPERGSVGVPSAQAEFCTAGPFGPGCRRPECRCEISAWGCRNYGCECGWVRCVCASIEEAHETSTRPHKTEELHQQQRWMYQDLFGGYILPGLMAVTEDMTAAALHQATIIGSLFDADMQQETNRLLQEMQAQAHKDYQVSEQLCGIASSTQSLGATDRKTDLTRIILSDSSLARHLGRINNNAAQSNVDIGMFFQETDGTRHVSGRLAQFRARFCHPPDMSGHIAAICAATDAEYESMDINVSELLLDPTLELNLLDEDMTPDEERIFAMSRLLFGHNVSPRMTISGFEGLENIDFSSDAVTAETLRPVQAYMDFRSLNAMRSVAENSFNTLLALKSEGTGGSAGFLTAILSEMGIDGDALGAYSSGNPSYYTQMGILTKKVFQNPQFYINLYDKPANIERHHLALRAIGLMQERDMFETQMRSEMLASILLELSLIEEQEEVEAKLRQIR